MSETTLLDRLRSSEILSAEQLRELSGLPEARDPDPKVLGKVVLQRGWLTRFQISQTAMGKGKDLFVGPYVLQDRLGEGGQGQVFKARHRHMKRVVALKLMRKEKLAREDSVQRFYQEVEAAAQLTHPNIVMAFDAGQAGNLHFISMEYVEGIDLMQLVREKGPLPIAQACDFIRQAALGLQHAHEQGMVHRDIKPSNLLVTTGEGKPVVKILDMGLARLGDSFAQERHLTKVGQGLGTPDYLAPEQAVDARHVDIRADIYSLGCSLFFLLTRRAPFQAESQAELLLKHQVEELPPIRSLRPDAPAALEDLLRRMLAKKPGQRPVTPAAVATALEPFARGEKGVPPPPPPVAIPPPPPPPSVGGDTFAGLTNDGEGLSARPARGKQDHSQDAMVERPSKTGSKKGETSRLPLLLAAGAGAGVLALLMIAGPIVLLLPAKKPDDQNAQKKTPAAPLPKVDPPPPAIPPPPVPAVEGPIKPAQRFVGHKGAVNCIVVSPDGKSLLSGGDDGSVRLWDAATGKEIRTFRSNQVLQTVRCVRFTRDGSKVIAVGETGVIPFWDAETGRSFKTVNYHSPRGVPAASIDASPKDEIVVIALSNSVLSVIPDARPAIGKHDFTDLVRCVASVNEGNRFAVGDGAGTIHIADMTGPNPMVVKTIANRSGAVLALAHSDKTNHLISATSDKTITVMLLKPQFKTLGIVRGHDGPVACLAVSPDGKRFVSGSKDKTIRVWDLETRTEIHHFTDDDEVRGVAFAADGKSVFSAGKAVRIWPLDAARP